MVGCRSLREVSGWDGGKSPWGRERDRVCVLGGGAAVEPICSAGQVSTKTLAGWF